MSCKVSFIGLGVMGYPMAGYISKAGHNVTVYNRTKAKAEKWIKEYKGEIAETPEGAAKDSDFVFTCVGNDNDLSEVTIGKNGIYNTIKKGAVHIDNTTASAEIARKLVEAGFGVLAVLTLIIYLAIPLRVLPGGSMEGNTYRWMGVETQNLNLGRSWVSWNFSGYEEKVGDANGGGWEELVDFVVTMDDLSSNCQMNFSKTPSRSPIRNSFHVYPAASIGWLHLHSYLGDFLTTAHDTMERQAISAGYKKNTTFEEVVSVL